jgi:tRNA A-37 threonylcarbamoyl transferase component Bud32
MSSSKKMIELGQTVGNYRVTALLGEGGMGAVYLAEHPVIGRKAALKVIHPQHARNADVVARFVNEAVAINRIGHEHTVEVTDFGRTPAGDFYFIMEYLEGQPLSELISREAPLDPERALRIAAQIADALTACHVHGVIHRDLKPENVFLVAHGDDPTFVKVLDFGLAKLIDANGGAAHETHAGVVMGTPYYMSPEQCQGKSALDARTDVYALGVVLFEMLTGKLPFGGRGYGEVLMKQISMRPPAARSLVPALPPSLDVVLHRALAKDPAERYPTMAAFREALLDPANHGAAPHASVHDDLSGRMRAARPMSRAEITLHRGAASGAHSTFEASAGEVDEGAHPVPRRRAPRAMALVALAALGGMALAAGLTYGRVSRKPAVAAAPQPAAPVRVQVTFNSDPGGATVVAADGTAVGTTPLSIQVARADQSVEYLIQKAGFKSKTMSLIPNLPSSMFALLVPEDPAVEDDPPPMRRVATATHHHHVKSAERLRDDLDDDGVLAPSFATETTP